MISTSLKVISFESKKEKTKKKTQPDKNEIDFGSSFSLYPIHWSTRSICLSIFQDSADSGHNQRKRLCSQCLSPSRLSFALISFVHSFNNFHLELTLPSGVNNWRPVKSDRLVASPNFILLMIVTLWTRWKALSLLLETLSLTHVTRRE